MTVPSVSATGGVQAPSSTSAPASPKPSSQAVTAGGFEAKLKEAQAKSDEKRTGPTTNTSGNVRDGQTFDTVVRDGRIFHVYGEGKDRKVFEIKP